MNLECNLYIPLQLLFSMKLFAVFILGILVSEILHFFWLQPQISPIFSPQDGSAIVDLIKNSKKSLDIEVYLLTSKEVILALKDAKKRGVDIRIILESNVMEGNNDLTYKNLLSEGFNIRYASRKFQLTHSKFIICDGNTVLVGSHNFSEAALNKNREASVIFSDYLAVSKFQNIFDLDWADAF